jgi:hypothetical protein
MSKLFKSVVSKKDDGWMQCNFGCSSIDSKDYVLTTHYLKADEVPEEMNDAKTASEMVAGLLNAYYMGIDVTKLQPDVICKMGVIEEEDSHNPNQQALF